VNSNLDACVNNNGSCCTSGVACVCLPAVAVYPRGDGTAVMAIGHHAPVARVLRAEDGHP
jgi:hypothetical protein